MTESAHAAGLPVIYHGCGNVAALLPDFIEIGVDAYNPLEAKAGLDVVDLRRRYGHKLAFCGNGDIRVLESGDPEAVKREVLRKLNAARGGGYIFQSDHSVTSGVSGRDLRPGRPAGPRIRPLPAAARALRGKRVIP